MDRNLGIEQLQSEEFQSRTSEAEGRGHVEICRHFGRRFKLLKDMLEQEWQSQVEAERMLQRVAKYIAHDCAMSQQNCQQQHEVRQQLECMLGIMVSKYQNNIPPA